MSEQLNKSRDLVTWLVIGGFALYLLVELIRMISAGVRFAFLGALSSYAPAMVGSVFVVAVALVLVWDSFGEPTRALRTQALAGVLLTVIGGGLGVLFGLIGIFDLRHVLEGLLSFLLTIAYAAVSAAALVVELRVLSGAPRPQPAQLAAGPWGPGQPYQGWPQPRWQPEQPGGGYPQGQPSAGFPQPQQPGGYPQGQPSAGYPQPQQPGGYPQGQPSAGYPQPRPSAGYPQPEAPAGYPQPQAPGGYPQGQPPAGYAHEQQSGYPTQPPTEHPHSGTTGWDDGEDRTRLVPRVGSSAGEPAHPHDVDRPTVPEQNLDTSFWDDVAAEPPAAQRDESTHDQARWTAPDRDQWPPRQDPPAGQG